jgi:hypothetical protein
MDLAPLRITAWLEVLRAWLSIPYVSHVFFVFGLHRSSHGRYPPLAYIVYNSHQYKMSATLSSRYNQNANAGLLCRLSGKLGEKQYSSSSSSSSFTKWHVEYHEAIDDDHAAKRKCGQNGFHRCIGIRWFWALMAWRSDHDGGMHSGSRTVLF